MGYTLTYPQSSVLNISQACGYSKLQVWNILSTYGAYPYRPILGQELWRETLIGLFFLMAL